MMWRRLLIIEPLKAVAQAIRVKMMEDKSSILLSI